MTLNIKYFNIKNYSTWQKLKNIMIFKCFNEDFCAHQGCIYVLKNTVKTVILWNIITI